MTQLEIEWIQVLTPLLPQQAGSPRPGSWWESWRLERHPDEGPCVHSVELTAVGQLTRSTRTCALGGDLVSAAALADGDENATELVGLLV